ncbi:glycosyltransferase family 2 protein [Variovorax sp. HJSM1_2]|uniref:glycosyltransferase family 2 protein n=1 Tax=Variovorax sp. HJSM1_2 TaxID=3366263 RepID=UPI003BD1A22C
MQSTEHVSCILVTYNPNQKKFLCVLDSLCEQADHIFIIDNSDYPLDLDFSQYKNLQYVSLNQNTGISTAQNIGIREAQKIGSKYIWLSDQDTIYPTGYLKNMMPFFKKASLAGISVAAIAPAYFDTTTNCLQPFTRHTPYTEYFQPQKGINLISHCIASGSIIPIHVFEKIGLMRDDLFIDMVDLEWCWRAKRIFGYQTIGIGDIFIQHTMGDGHVYFRGQKISFRSPTRHYYMIRNSIALSLHSNSATLVIRLELFIKTVVWLFILPLIAPQQKKTHFKATLRGLLDGVLNKLGPMKNPIY